jgi:hypothetical protein
MRPTRTQLVGLAAALSTIAIAAPVSAAAAAAPVAIVSGNPDGSPAVTLAAPGHAGTVTGPTFITEGSATFTGTHIVVSSGDASLGG